jgi:hypothetical protein
MSTCLILPKRTTQYIKKPQPSLSMSPHLIIRSLYSQFYGRISSQSSQISLLSHLCRFSISRFYLTCWILIWMARFCFTYSLLGRSHILRTILARLIWSLIDSSWNCSAYSHTFKCKHFLLFIIEL